MPLFHFLCNFDPRPGKSAFECDQMARLFSNIGPFINMIICPKALQIGQSRLKFGQRQHEHLKIAQT